jgi:hypothetical protein
MLLVRRWGSSFYPLVRRRVLWRWYTMKSLWQLGSSNSQCGVKARRASDYPPALFSMLCNSEQTLQNICLITIPDVGGSANFYCFSCGRLLGAQMVSRWTTRRRRNPDLLFTVAASYLGFSILMALGALIDFSIHR